MTIVTRKNPLWMLLSLAAGVVYLFRRKKKKKKDCDTQ